MDFNQNGGFNDNGLQGFIDDPPFPGNENYEWNEPYNDQHHFYPSFDEQQSSSYHDYNYPHHNYQDDSHHYGLYQQPYQSHHEPTNYYQAPPEPAPYQYHTLESHQSHSYPPQQPPQPPPQPVPQPARSTQTTPSRADRAVQTRYNPDYINRSRTLRTPTNPYRDVSPSSRPFHDEPIRELAQFTRKRFGGPLAAHAAAVAKAEAKAEAVKLAAKIPKSPPKKEETVRDVLQRQYQEKKRQEEEMQLLQQQHQSFYQGLPNSFPPPLFHSRPPHPSHMQPSMPGPPLLPVNRHLDQPEPSATPIFTFPVVPPRGSSSSTTSSTESRDEVVRSDSPPTRDAPSLLLTPAHIPFREDPEDEIAVNQQAVTVAVCSTSPVQNQPTGIESATVGQSQLSSSSSSSSSRKRSAETPIDYDHPAVDKRPGVRRERNEAGEEVDRLYVLVHHCNHNDPDYDPEGVLMLKEDYDRERSRDDMVSINFYSKGTPHEYVDFRVMKKTDFPPPSEAASSST